MTNYFCSKIERVRKKNNLHVNPAEALLFSLPLLPSPFCLLTLVGSIIAPNLLFYVKLFSSISFLKFCQRPSKLNSPPINRSQPTFWKTLLYIFLSCFCFYQSCTYIKYSSMLHINSTSVYSYWKWDIVINWLFLTKMSLYV